MDHITAIDVFSTLYSKHNIFIVYQLLIALASAYTYSYSSHLLIQFSTRPKKKKIARTLVIISLSLALWSINLSGSSHYNPTGGYEPELLIVGSIIAIIFAYSYIFTVLKYKKSCKYILVISVIFALAQHCIFYISLLTLAKNILGYVSILSSVLAITISSILFAASNYIIFFKIASPNSQKYSLYNTITIILTTIALLCPSYISMTINHLVEDETHILYKHNELSFIVINIIYAALFITIGIAISFLYSQLKKSVKYFGITVKISTTFMILTIISAGLSTYIVYKLSNEYVNTATKNASDNSTKLAELYVNQYVDNLKNTGLFLSNKPIMRQIIENDDMLSAIEKLKGEIHPLFIQNPEYFKIQLVQTKEDVIESITFSYINGMTHTTIESLADDKLITIIDNTKKYRNGEIYIPPIKLYKKSDSFIKANQPIINVSIPLYNNQGTTHGILLLTASFDHILDKLIDSANKDSNIYIANNEGALLKLSIKETTHDNVEYNSCGLIQDCFPVIESAYTNTSTERISFFETTNDTIKFSKLSFDAVPEQFITLIEVIKKENIEYFFMTIQIYVYFIISILIVLSLICASFFARHITRPIENITKCAVSFSKGGDLSNLLPLQSNDEVGILARALQYLHKQNVIKSQELEQSEYKFRQMFEYSPIGLVLSDLEGNLIQANQSYYSLIGYQNEEDRNNIMTINVHEEWYNELKESILKTGFYGPYEQVYIHKDGYEVPIIISSILVKNKTENEYIWSFVQDITENKAKEKKLDEYYNHLEDLIKERTHDLELMKEKAENANEVKSEFLSNMTHELRTPLHAILSFSRIGKERATTIKPEQLQEFFSDIQNSGNRLLVLVNNLLDISKSEAGKMILEKRSNDFKNTIDQSLKELSSLIQDKEITLQYTTEEDQFITQYDNARIVQVIINLLSNAIKFSPKFSTITIDCNQFHQDNTDYIQIIISDEGIGIAPTELNSIFDKFEQGSKTKTKAGGTGLGLAICREIIHLHDGKIWAYINDNQGASFTFIIPLYVKKEDSD